MLLLVGQLEQHRSKGPIHPIRYSFNCKLNNKNDECQKV